jgi:hypothetical protein
MDATATPQLKQEFLSTIHKLCTQGLTILDLAQLLEAYGLAHSEPILEVPVFDKVFNALEDEFKDSKLELAERILKEVGFGI